MKGTKLGQYEPCLKSVSAAVVFNKAIFFLPYKCPKFGGGVSGGWDNVPTLGLFFLTASPIKSYVYYTGHLKLIKPNLLELGCDKIIPNISTNHLILNTELGFDKTLHI